MTGFKTFLNKYNESTEKFEIYHLYLFYFCINSYTWWWWWWYFFCISMGESYIYFYDYMCNQEESLKYWYLKTTLVFFFCFFYRFSYWTQGILPLHLLSHWDYKHILFCPIYYMLDYHWVSVPITVLSLM